MKLLYINGQLVDLYPNTVIAQTLQIFDPGKIGSVTTNYTSSIRVPHTARNEIIVGFLRNSKTKSDYPYTSGDVKYIENGFPLIRNGRVVLTESNEKEYNFTIYSGPWGFFESISNKSLWDLDFSDINGPWTQAARDGYRNATTGILDALMDDGRLDQSSPPTIENRGSTLKIPQIYYHSVIAHLFQGFEFEGDIFDNPIYNALAIPLSVIYNDPSFLESKMFFAASPGTQIITNPVTAQEVIFNKNVKQGSENFYDSVSKYIIVNPDTSGRYFRLFFKTELTINVTGGTVDLRIEATAYTPVVVSNVGSGSYSINFLSSIGQADGDVTKVTVIKNTGTPIVTIQSGLFYTTAFTGTDGFEFFPSITAEYVYFQKLFEYILLTDFLRDFCVRFGVQVTQINNKIICNTLNKILDDRTGPDWTLIRDKGLDRIRYTFSSYGKVNYIKAPKDSEFTPDLSDNYGDGSFEIPNENLKDNSTIYTGIFNVSEMITTFGVFMLKMNLEPAAANFARMPGKRLFFVRDKYAFEPDVVYDSIPRDDYKIAYYFDPDQDRELSWQFFIEQFQRKFVDRCLRKVRLIEREYILSDLDVYAFDQQKPIWDNNERFLVTKISNRVSGKSCKIELLKIDSNPEITFIENLLAIALTDYLEITGEASQIQDYFEQIVMTLNNEDPNLDLRVVLVESVTGNPTWQTTFNNGSTTRVMAVIGNLSVNNNTIPISAFVSAVVIKTNNDGNGPNGFPTKSGYVEWMRNGVRLFTKPFNGATGSSVQNLAYTFGVYKTLKTAVRVATTVGGTLATSFSNGQTVDGVVIATADRICIKNQADPRQNGVYIVTAGPPVRSTDCDSNAELADTAVPVTLGTANAGKIFQQVTSPVTVGSSNIVFLEAIPLIAGDLLRVNIFEDNSTP